MQALLSTPVLLLTLFVLRQWHRKHVGTSGAISLPPALEKPVLTAGMIALSIMSLAPVKPVHATYMKARPNSTLALVKPVLVMVGVAPIIPKLWP